MEGEGEADLTQNPNSLATVEDYASIEPGSHEALLYRKSIEKFLDRQEVARRLKAPDNSKKAGSGMLWKNEMTVPQSFHFATDSPEPIHSLRKVGRRLVTHSAGDA